MASPRPSQPSHVLECPKQCHISVSEDSASTASQTTVSLLLFRNSEVLYLKSQPIPLPFCLSQPQSILVQSLVWVMKKNQDRHLLVTPLNILCIHKKCSELFYDQLVRIHTKGYMQKANRLLRNDSLPHTVSLLCIPTADSRKISVAVLWHYYKHLAWPRFQPSHS